MKAFLLRSGIRKGCPLSPFPLNIVLEVLVAIRQEKRNKRHTNQNGRIKLSPFADDMIENPKDSTKKSFRTDKQTH